MRRRRLSIGVLLVILVVLVAMSVVPVSAAPPHPGLDFTPSTKGKNGKMYFVEYDGTKNVVGTGAWAKMRHNRSGNTFDYTLNAYGLLPVETYALVYKETPWSEPHGVFFGTAETDANGKLTIKDSESANFYNDCNPVKAWLWIVPCGYPDWSYECGHTGNEKWLIWDDSSPDWKGPLWYPDPPGPDEPQPRYLVSTAEIVFEDTDIEVDCPVNAP
ncbi:hypothetical protein ACFLWA_10515 [Chloroflexota bacterium]